MLCNCMGNLFRMKKNSAKHYSRTPSAETGLERHIESAEEIDLVSEDLDDPIDDGREFNDEVPATAPAAPDLVPMYLDVDSAGHG